MDAETTDQGPYFEAWEFIQNHPGTGGSNRIAKLVLSLWNDDCAFAFSECCTSLDTARKQLAALEAAGIVRETSGRNWGRQYLAEGVLAALDDPGEERET